jgi:hypothetical protein
MGNNDYEAATGRKSFYDVFHNDPIVQYGVVVSVDDDKNLGRIKVRIKGPRNRGGDDGLTDVDLPWAFPMMSKLISVQPKVGEAVFIFVFNIEKQHVDRMYLGPIISQPQLLDFDPYNFTALSGFKFANLDPAVDVNSIPEIVGVFPNPQDVSIQGRFNTDITQKRNEIVIRAGKFEKTDSNKLGFKFNAKTQGYIQIKNDTVISNEEIKSNSSIVSTQPSTTVFATEERGTITNIVSDRINLLTHKGSPSFKLLGQENLISDEEMVTILKTAHQVPFGDILLEYLILLKNAVLNHVHNGNGNSATDLISGGAKLDVKEFKDKASDLESKMLSQNIRIN